MNRRLLGGKLVSNFLTDFLTIQPIQDHIKAKNQAIKIRSQFTSEAPHHFIDMAAEIEENGLTNKKQGRDSIISVKNSVVIQKLTRRNNVSIWIVSY